MKRKVDILAVQNVLEPLQWKVWIDNIDDVLPTVQEFSGVEVAIKGFLGGFLYVWIDPRYEKSWEVIQALLKHLAAEGQTTRIDLGGDDS